MRTESASSRVNEGAVSKKGAEPSPTDDQLADDSHGDQVDTIEVDHENDQDKTQFEEKKSILREATPDYSDERNSSKKTFPERPSKALLKGEKRTLREATPGQPRDESLLDD